MSGDLNSASQCFGLYEGREIIGFCAVIHQPHPSTKMRKRVHRLVILPDYQGIGLGKKFLNAVADIYCQKGYIFTINTSAKNLIHGLANDPHWKLRSFSVPVPGHNSGKIDASSKSHRNCKTGQFSYIRKKR